MNSFENLKTKILNAEDISFGDIINDAIELFKKVWLKGFLTVLFVMVAGFGFNFIFQLIGLSADPLLLMDGFDLESLLNFYSQNAIYSIPQTILLSSVSLLFLAAFYRICKQAYFGEAENDDYFYFFKKKYFSKILVLGMIYTGIATVAQLLFILPFIYVFVPLSYFSIVFANNHHLSEVEIVKTSFAIGHKKWLVTFGTIFVCGILGMLGIIGCGIGLLFTISIAYLPVFFIYNSVVGFDDKSEIDSIGMIEA